MWCVVCSPHRRKSFWHLLEGRAAFDISRERSVCRVRTVSLITWLAVHTHTHTRGRAHARHEAHARVRREHSHVSKLTHTRTHAFTRSPTNDPRTRANKARNQELRPPTQEARASGQTKPTCADSAPAALSARLRALASSTHFVKPLLKVAPPLLVWTRRSSHAT